MISSSMFFANKLVDLNDLFKSKEMWEARLSPWFVTLVEEEVCVEAKP